MKTLAIVFGITWAGFTGLALHTVATPCQTEDSAWCTWDAATRSNGHGISFIALWAEDMYIITGGK